MACETRLEGGLEVEEMYVLDNYNPQHEGYRITPILPLTSYFKSIVIKLPNSNVEIHMHTRKSKCKLFSLNKNVKSSFEIHIYPNGT